MRSLLKSCVESRVERRRAIPRSRQGLCTERASHPATAPEAWREQGFPGCPRNRRRLSGVRHAISGGLSQSRQGEPGGFGAAGAAAACAAADQPLQPAGGDPRRTDFPVASAALVLDGIADLHKPLFALLDAADGAERAAHFGRLHGTPLPPQPSGRCRLRRRTEEVALRASYLRVVRGWAFDAESREAAVLKGWVESRFGLCPRHHGEALREPGSAAWQRYVEMRAAGLYGTNALENSSTCCMPMPVRTGAAVSAAQPPAPVSRRQSPRRARDPERQRPRRKDRAAQQRQFLLALARARRRVRRRRARGRRAAGQAGLLQPAAARHAARRKTNTW
jgi:hypothetical protein